MKRTRLCQPMIAVLLLLTGCASVPPRTRPSSATGDASWHAVVPPGTRRYRLALGEVSSGAVLADRVRPVYPPDLLAACPPPMNIQALLIMDQSGGVREVRLTDDGQAGSVRRRFGAAVRVAALQWRFSPLQISHWAADAEGNSHVVDSVTQPFSLAYVFRFECHAGKSMVSSAAVKS